MANKHDLSITFLFFSFWKQKSNLDFSGGKQTQLGHDVAILFSFRNKLETVRYTGRQTKLEHNVSNPAPH